ncbi:unnamed protein product [Paramecium pentaurelia]|uniref:Uncharacterized protein n=1 Tax=Paramecium pentaurelia TaxID=43138 RepID=A0A8S1YBT6_9CILI|nr:unnamed protein product [Paramecium pentaurelia]
MISNDTLTPMQQTAQFYIPPGFSFHKRSLKRLNPQNDKDQIQTINNINPTLNIKSNSQPNLLNLTRDKNFSFHFDSQQQPVQQNSIKKQLCLLGIQQRLLFPRITFKKQNSLDIDAINTVSSPEKSKKMLRALLMPQKKMQNIVYQNNHRSTKSQGRSFLQSRPQLNLLNRIFSSKSQHEL